MNKVLEVFEKLSNEELKEVIIEIKNSENTGVIEANSVVRKCANKVSDITGNSISTELFMSQMNLLKQAAFRWAINPVAQTSNPNKTLSPIINPNVKPDFGICVDAGTIGNPGPCFYRGIDIETKQVLFHEELGIGTNNIAEFLAVCHAVMYCEKNPHLNGITTANIWSDSNTAIAWFKNKKHKSTFDGKLKERLDKAIEYNRKYYETFKYKNLNTTLNIIDDNDNITIRDSWRKELRDFFIIKKLKPIGDLIRVNRTSNHLNLGDSGEIVIYYKEYDDDKTDKENYLNPQVYGILIELNGETYSFGSVDWKHYDYQNKIGELCLNLINLGYLPLISSLEPDAYGTRRKIKYSKNSYFKKIIKNFNGKKSGVSRTFDFNWILIKEVNGSYKTRLSFYGHRESGSYVHDYEANYEYESYLNKKLGASVNWLGYNSSDHSYKYDATIKKIK